jgi:phenylalanine-4-hydroxylase
MKPLSKVLAQEGEIVRLDPDHPGFRDPVYRARRNEIARLALKYREGEPLPRVDYTEDEQSVWRLTWERLAPLHGRVRRSSRSTARACRSSPT